MIYLREYIVIFITILTIPSIFRLIISRQITQQAMSWWYQRQHVRMCQEAELIRNQMLQELFVLRRNIELAQLNSSQTTFDEKNLEHIQRIHSSLVELSEYFYPAHLDDSLPLAIRCFIKSSQSRLSNLDIQLELPEEWNKESEEMSRVLLMILSESFEIFDRNQRYLSSVLVSLNKNSSNKQLRLEIQHNSQPHHDNSDYLQELKSLGHIFQTFTRGKFCYMQNGLNQIGCFNW